MMFSCLISWSTLISLNAVKLTPSLALSSLIKSLIGNKEGGVEKREEEEGKRRGEVLYLIFLRATRLPVAFSLARYTTPKVYLHQRPK